ncbi:MAG: EF-P lysine aminoacylase GenX [Polyangiaceae bacterium]|nr:EF-P lysine aminoacylase GenX [Polyangiaceae bacterium]
MRRAGAWSPSDVLRGELVGDVEVGGRVRRSGDRAALVDAFGSLDLDALGPQVRDGDLVVVWGRVEARSLRSVRVIDHRPTTRHEGASDVARLLERGVGAALEARARAAAALRALFASWRFLEVETPSLVPCPGLDTHLDAFEAFPTAALPRFLITSPEYQMKRLLVGGIPRCFQLARSFRRGELGSRHNPEFTMLEWYRAFSGMNDVLEDTEAIVLAVNAEIGGPQSLLSTLDLERPFPRLSVAEAFERFAGVAATETLRLADEDSEQFYRLLIERVEPGLATLGAPVFLERYPASMASLARTCADDPRFAERFELYACGVELCNGFGELTHGGEQRARFERDRAERTARGLPVYPIDERFLTALEEGMPPSGGNALGFDRLVMLALGAPSLDAVMAFPEREL